MIEHNNNGLRYYTFESFPANRVEHGLYTRLGGQSQRTLSGAESWWNRWR